MNNIQENNQVTISGDISSRFIFNHELFGEKFYLVDVRVRRTSGTCDFLPVMVSERLASVSEDLTGVFVKVSGNFRSFNKHENGKSRLILSVFAKDFEIGIPEENENIIFLDGFICKTPVYRKTPLRREIADVLLAVNRSYGKTDYIPCICWGRNARFATRLKVGKRIKVFGRVQSRNYIKRCADGREEDRTAYEVSASRIDVVVNENQNTEE